MLACHVSPDNPAPCSQTVSKHAIGSVAMLSMPTGLVTGPELDGIFGIPLRDLLQRYAASFPLLTCLLGPIVRMAPIFVRTGRRGQGTVVHALSNSSHGGSKWLILIN